MLKGTTTLYVNFALNKEGSADAEGCGRKKEKIKERFLHAQ